MLHRMSFCELFRRAGSATWQWRTLRQAQRRTQVFSSLGHVTENTACSSAAACSTATSAAAAVTRGERAGIVCATRHWRGARTPRRHQLVPAGARHRPLTAVSGHDREERDQVGGMAAQEPTQTRVAHASHAHAAAASSTSGSGAASLPAFSAAGAPGTAPRTAHGVVFDLDGTLTLPHAIDFKRMRERCGIPQGEDIIHWVNSQPEPERSRLHAIVEEEEEAGLARMALMPGALQLLDWLAERRVPRAVLTRNNESAMLRTLALLERPDAFSVLLSRSFHPPKPAPDALHHIASRWALHPSQLIMVGDSSDDMLAGRGAGALAVCIGADARARALADHVVESMEELLALLSGTGAVDLRPAAAPNQLPCE